MLIALSLITLAAIGALVLLDSSYFDVDEVVVVGGEHTSHDAVREASGVEIGTPLVDLDPGAAVAGVQRLPWVATTEIVREWNGTITITITERTPVLALPSETGGFVLVDVTGRQLDLVAERPPWSHIVNGLVTSGVPGQPSPTEIHGVIRLLGLLTADQMEGIESISVVDSNLVLDLRAGGIVDLGNDSGLADKLVSYDTLRASVDLRCLHRIDLRVPSAPAITRISATGETGRALSDMTNCT